MTSCLRRSASFQVSLGVGVQERPQHEERDPHGGHAHAVAPGGIGVPELVDHLGEADRDRVVQERLRREHARHRVGDAVPLARHQVQVEPEQHQHHDHEAAREEHVGQRDGAGEERVGPEQRQAEEQVVVQHLPVPGVFRLAQATGEDLLRHRALRREQLVRREKLKQVLQLLGRGRERRVRRDLGEQRVGVALRRASARAARTPASRSRRRNCEPGRGCASSASRRVCVGPGYRRRSSRIGGSDGRCAPAPGAAGAFP